MTTSNTQYVYEPRHRHTGDEPWNTPNLSVTSYPPANFGSSTTVFDKSLANTGRNMSRTPSPTPSEAKELKTGAFDWETLSKWRFWIRKEWIWYYVALVIICTLTALMTIYHEEIVEWLTPVTRWMHDLPFGWLVPIGILFVISFPPLFGHEIVAILCGLVWGLWIGFGIVSAGTFLGEVGNFYAFKYCCRARGEKMERTKLTYACLAKVVRDGGFKIALIARLSAIPGHFTTAVFSTCGMGIIVFSLAAILSLPKQFITVYLGVILEQSASGTQDTKSRIISNVVLALTFFITILAMWYIYRQMNKVKPDVIYERRKARQAKMQGYTSTSEVQMQSYASTSDLHIPLQQNIVYAPTPSSGYQYSPSNNYKGSTTPWEPAMPSEQHPRSAYPQMAAAYSKPAYLKRDDDLTQHEPEATELSYHTALESVDDHEHGRMSPPVEVQDDRRGAYTGPGMTYSPSGAVYSGAQRTFSPPPPSYMSQPPQRF